MVVQGGLGRHYRGENINKSLPGSGNKQSDALQRHRHDVVTADRIPTPDAGPPSTAALWSGVEECWDYPSINSEMCSGGTVAAYPTNSTQSVVLLDLNFPSRPLLPFCCCSAPSWHLAGTPTVLTLSVQVCGITAADSEMSAVVPSGVRPRAAGSR
ncbi:hypothetical protein E2C01_000250 [Portunus trituberculatus]|uniref:Uncharacterized protein n=1 Tax=Portunus trituberculatus TaxID=210409 RepID=A0A5B7CG52_PORTR|nr:hypothetical protein [Portunus trituberculatus]